MIVSEFNQKISDARQARLKEAEKKFEAERNKEIMENVLKNLGKKDSLKVLVDIYESTLHKADHINESPTENERVRMLAIDETETDEYSKLTAVETISLVDKKGSGQNVHIDKHILKMTTGVRNQ